MKVDVLNQKVKSAFLNKSFKKYSFLSNFRSFSHNNPTKFLDPSLKVISKITTKGKIKVCNSDFCKSLDCSHDTIKNKEITSVFHPEMPKVIIEIVQSALEKGKSSLAIVKQLDTKGNTVWLNSHFSPTPLDKLAFSCHINATPTSIKTVTKIEKIYKTVFLLENNSGYDIAKKYFSGMLEMEYGNYEGFIIDAFQ